MARRNEPPPAPDASVTRSARFDLIAPDDAVRDAVRSSVARYRAACRQLYAALALSQAAGATLRDDDGRLRLVPDGERAAQLLELATGKPGKALGYQLRDWFRADLYPGSLSFVWDSARRDVATAWAAHDPEFPKARRGYLALQGARGLAEFRGRGIGFPAATGRPKLDGYALTLKWDTALGAVAFKLPDLDPGRRHVWLSLRDNDAGWALGTLYLGERDGRLYATISHSRPADRRSLDAKRLCRVEFGDGPATFLRLRGPDGGPTADGIDAYAAVAALVALSRRREQLEQRRAACGSPRRPWGHRKGWLASQDVLSRVTLQRERQVADYNHAWTRRIADRALHWRCGTIRVDARPETLLGYPWKWQQFGEFLKYKADFVGIAVELA